MKVPRRPGSAPARRVSGSGAGGSGRRRIAFDDARPAWDGTSTDLAQFKLDKQEQEVRPAPFQKHLKGKK
jgi:hypothetical protein